LWSLKLHHASTYQLTLSRLWSLELHQVSTSQLNLHGFWSLKLHQVSTSQLNLSRFLRHLSYSLRLLPLSSTRAVLVTDITQLSPDKALTSS